MQHMKIFVTILILELALSSPMTWEVSGQPVPGRPSLDEKVYLPAVWNSAAPSAARRINAPYFDVPNVVDQRFTQMAVFWFGQVNQTDNYSDVRVGYNNTTLYIRTATFDRRIWYDQSPSSADLTNWDAITLYLDTSGDPSRTLTSASYRFKAQFNWSEDDQLYSLSERGNGATWQPALVSFQMEPGWRGDAPNNDQNDRGWLMTFEIPFSSLGVQGPPAEGSLWRLGMELHDRDDAAGTPIAIKTWPEGLDGSRPSTWGRLGFGLPVYQPPPSAPAGTVTVRHKLNGATVKDAAAGGYSVCGDGRDFWTQWGDTTETFYDPEHTSFNIQNQIDVADWPCFSKYYVTFPLDLLPAGKVIRSAELTLHLFGNAGASGEAKNSLIQVFSISEDWDENNLTWNNAPLAFENVSRAWVEPVMSMPPWPGVPWTWDLSYAVAQAYAARQPLRLVLYSADSAYHSGKYFVSSDTGDWNAAGRPMLEVKWGEPGQ